MTFYKYGFEIIQANISSRKMSSCVCLVFSALVVTGICVEQNVSEANISTKNITNLKNEISLNKPENFTKEILTQDTNLTMERIVQPVTQISVQTQQEVNVLHFPLQATDNKEITQPPKDKIRQRSEEDFKPSPRDFRPSPQLESYFEFNKHPVIPVVGEPKTFPSWNFQEKPTKIEEELYHVQIEKTNPFNKRLPTSNSFTFPTSAPNKATLDSPYQFVSTQKEKDEPKQRYIFEVHSTTENYGRVGLQGEVFNRVPYINEEVYEVKELERNKPSMHKTFYEYPYYHPQRDYKYLFLKKAIKFLATVIPLGLLISALSPTIVNVSPMNDTMMQTSGRTNKHLENASSSSFSFSDLGKILSKECEERIICELILGSQEAKDRQDNVERLLQSFTKQERELIDNTQELKIIFQAARNDSCETIPCEGFPNKPERSDT